ncbi:unnamed protein product [Protopolystoma xenopodis]|uniref:Uncharacterized protein n=1 Tax=Protopolystoma xenopodis TaxID=117903 RepID=A0A3S5FEE7_9PLAT|nr:unnamed protein product [Protopolystoma xenopodis]
MLGLAIDAARARCSVGEITDAMAVVFGRHQAAGRLVSGAYRSAYGEGDEFSRAVTLIEVGYIVVFNN